MRRIDPRTNRVVATVPVGLRALPAWPSTDDAVWATSLVVGTVTRIDPRTNRVVAIIETGGRPVQVAADDRSVWVAYPLDTLVRRIDPRTNRVVASLRVAQPQDVALGFGSVWVASERAGEVLRIDPRTTPDRRGRRADQGGRGAGVPRRRPRRGLGRDQPTARSSGSTPRPGTVTATFPVEARPCTAWPSTGRWLWTVDPVGDTVSRARLPGRGPP